MKVKNARRYVRRFTYKPKTKFRIEGTSTWPVVVLHQRVVDTNNPKKKIPVVTYRLIPAGQKITKQYLSGAIAEIAESWETHEASEWLRFDGERLSDPHG